jgi:glucosamine-6-phosphate deaminase
MQVNGLTIRQYRSPDRAAHALAGEVVQALAARPGLVLGLPTGHTPLPLYRRLVALHRAGRADFSGITTFNLDEFVGVSGDHPGSYRAFMRAHLFGPLGLRPRQTHMLDGLAADTLAECRRYDSRIARAGGLDLLILGLGVNGHIGFNEPGAALEGPTHRTRLTTATRRANADLFGNRLSRVPREALSMGMATILRARRIVLLATGPSKAAVVKQVVHGRVTPRVPASFLQLHPAAEVWLDRAAAGALSESAG